MAIGHKIDVLFAGIPAIGGVVIGRDRWCTKAGSVRCQWIMKEQPEQL